MEAPPWHIHVLDCACRVKCSELEPKPSVVMSSDPLRLTLFKEPPQAFMADGHNHLTTVAQCATRNTIAHEVLWKPLSVPHDVTPSAEEGT